MKKGIKIIGNILAILIISMLLVGKVYAVSFKFNVASDKTEAKAGEEIVVSMDISNIDMGDLRNKYNRRRTRI